MEYREDLKKLSWDALYHKLIDAENLSTEYSDAILGLNRTIRGLRDELKAAQDSLAKIERPVFEVGKCYRNRRGEIRGPLESAECGDIGWTVRDCDLFYREDGSLFSDKKDPRDLLPGPFDPPPTWKPPASMPSGEWRWCQGNMLSGGYGFNRDLRTSVWHDWTDPPRGGRWQVTDGTATYLGAD